MGAYSSLQQAGPEGPLGRGGGAFRLVGAGAAVGKWMAFVVGEGQAPLGARPPGEHGGQCT